MIGVREIIPSRVAERFFSYAENDSRAGKGTCKTSVYIMKTFGERRFDISP